jgi:hypothetical protein
LGSLTRAKCPGIQQHPLRSHEREL